MSAVLEEVGAHYFDEDRWIDITEYQNVRNSKPEHCTSMPWSEIIYFLGQRKFREDKDGPLFGPYKLKDGAKRSSEAVEYYSLLVLDIDSKNQPVPYKNLPAILHKYEHVAYSTHQHTNERPRYRVVIPFTEKVSVEKYRVVEAQFRQLMGDVPDSCSGNISQAFYLPSCPASAAVDAFFHHVPGIGLDPNLSLVEVKEVVAVPDIKLLESSVERSRFPPTEENVRKILSALNKRVEKGGWNEEEKWFLTMLEVRSLTNEGWPDELAWEIFDGWSQQVGGNYDKEKNCRRWDHRDPESKNPRTYASLLHELNDLSSLKTEGSIFTSHTKFTPVAQRFSLLSFDYLKSLPQATWLVKGIFPEKGLASIYGPSNSGKTFLALDCGLAIALGKEWFGRAVLPRPVIYVALEGAYGLRQRLDAWGLHRNENVPETFKLILDHLSLFNGGDVEEFAQVVNDAGLNGGVIVIDTLNQSAPEADENTSKDMGRIISKAKQLQQLTDSLVILVHHAGKDTTRGLRGHSSLIAALDVAIEVKSDQQGRSWAVAKSKDAPTGVGSNFKLTPVVVGQDADGADITSMIVEPDSSAIFAKQETKKKSVGGNQAIALRVLRDLEKQIPPPVSGEARKIKTEEALKAIAAVLIVDPKRKKERAQSALNGLYASGVIGQKDEYVWLT